MSLIDYGELRRLEVAQVREQTLNNQYTLTHGGTLGTRNYYGSTYVDDTPDGNTAANTAVTGTSNADTINNFAPYVTINGGAGNDTINNNRRGEAYSLAGAYSNIDGGADNDYIDNKEWCDFSFISGGAGDDTVISRAAGSTVLGGAGNDSLQNITGSVSLNGGAGNDLINDTGAIGTGNTITGGAGSDTISLESAAGNNLIQYTSGDGNDMIIGLDSSDTLSISGDNYSTATSGSDMIVTVGTGTITLVGAGGTSPNIRGTYGSSTVQAVTSVATVDSSSSSTTTSYYDDDYESVRTVSYSNNEYYYPTTNYSSRVYAGGDQIISDYQSGEQIMLGTAPTGAFFGGGNFALTSATGTLFIANANDKLINFTDGAGNDFAKAYAATAAGVIDGRGLAGYEVITGSDWGGDVIYAGDGGSQLWGGNGFDADVLTGGGGSDIFIGGKTQGSDIIFNASSADVVNLNDATLSDIVAAGEANGVIVLAFNTGNVVAVQSSELLSSAFMLADGSAYRYNHAAQVWQGA